MINTNIKIFFLPALILAAVLMPGLTQSLKAQTVTQGYSSDENLQTGMLVAVTANDPNKVEALKDDTLKNVKGVVVQRNESPFTISSENQNVFVANIGKYEVLVSDENGAIKSGDHISISSSAGIAMKAKKNQPVVVGRALSDFGETERGSDKKVGRILVDIAIDRNPQLEIVDNDRIPDFIQRFGESVADKQVPNSRLYLAIGIVIATLFITGTTLYSGVRSCFIAVGRNPLSKNLLYKGLVQVTLIGVIIFLCGLFGVYLLLKL